MTEILATFVHQASAFVLSTFAIAAAGAIVAFMAADALKTNR